MADTAVAQPTKVITDTDHGALVTLYAAMFMVFMFLFYIIRILVRVGFKTTIGTDDVAATVGTIAGVAQSIPLFIAVKVGLGKNINLLSEDNLYRIGLLVYSADLLFIFTLALAKISAAELIARMSRQRGHTVACRTVSYLAALWGVISILIIGIGCSPRTPWRRIDRCGTLGSSWTCIAAFGIALELTLLILPIWLVWPLQMNMRTKLKVTVAFWLRIVLIPMAVIRVIELNRTTHSTNWTFETVKVILWTQSEMHMSMIAATAPCTRPFLKAAETHMWRSDVVGIDRATKQGTNDSSYAMTSYVSGTTRRSMKKNSAILSSPRTSTGVAPQDEGIQPVPAHLESRAEHPVLDPFSAPTLTTVQHQDRQSQSSYESDRNFIKKTMDFDIRYTTQERRR